MTEESGGEKAVGAGPLRGHQVASPRHRQMALLVRRQQADAESRGIRQLQQLRVHRDPEDETGGAAQRCLSPSHRFVNDGLIISWIGQCC